MPAYALVAGVPARQIGWACECGVPLAFEGAEAACGHCGRGYLKVDERTIRKFSDMVMAG